MTRIVRTDRAASLLSGGALVAASLAAALLGSTASVADTFVKAPAPAVDEPAASAPATEKAVVAGGCFWGVQAVFQHVKGVKQAVSGYAGGKASTASYHVVGSGLTGHAEAVEITYDPKQVSYGELLRIYFSVAHDPTQLNRQGPDSGTQYRSAIFTTNAEQAKVAGAYIDQLDKAKVFDKKIATTVSPLPAFYPAEDYHQDYATLNPDSGYIAINDAPKVEHLASLFPEVYRAQPVLVSPRTQ